MSVKPKYKVKVERCYRIVITDETDKEVWDDFWFGSKDGAIKIGDSALKRINEGTLPGVLENDLLLKEEQNVKKENMRHFLHYFFYGKDDSECSSQ